MRRLASAFLSACLLIGLSLLARPAQAGDYYYGEGYYPHGYYGDYYRPHRHHHASVWYSSSCCYRKVVRHVTTVHYERVDEGYPYYRHPYYRGYHEHPYYRHPYYEGYNYRPYRHYSLGYGAVGYPGYAVCGRIRIPDGRGGWVWGRPAGCF
jgi:hypothetical protein